MTQLITAPGQDAGMFLTNFPARGWLAGDKLRAFRDALIYLNFAGLEHSPVTPAPLLGQHTDEILADTLGMSGSEISKLHDQAVVAGSSEAPWKTVVEIKD